MELTDLKPSEQLDKVLKCFLNIKTKRATLSQINYVLKTDFSTECKDKYLEYILDKLYKDGFINFKSANPLGVVSNNDTKNNNTKFYSITFEGKSLLEIDFGYAGILASENANIVLEKNNEKYLRYGALAAAIGTCSYLVWDVIKYVLEHNCCCSCHYQY
jgi:hypothetical protein